MILLKIIGFSNLSLINISGVILGENIPLVFEKINEKKGSIIETSFGKVLTKEITYTSQPFILNEGNYKVEISGIQTGLTAENEMITLKIHGEKDIKVINTTDLIKRMFKRIKIIGMGPYTTKEVYKPSKENSKKLLVYTEKVPCNSGENCSLSFDVILPPIFRNENITGKIFVYRYNSIYPPVVSLYEVLDTKRTSCQETEEIYGKAVKCSFVAHDTLRFDEGFYRIVYSIELLNNSFFEVSQRYISEEGEEMPFFVERTLNNKTILEIYKRGKFIGIIPVKYRIKVYFDESGYPEKIEKPWWAIFVYG